MTTVSSVSTVQPQTVIYDLNELFDAAVTDRKIRAAELEKYAGSEHGNALCSALLNRATTVVDALQAFKNAGAQQVQTKYALEYNPVRYNPDSDLCNQIERGQVRPVFK